MKRLNPFFLLAIAAALAWCGVGDFADGMPLLFAGFFNLFGSDSQSSSSSSSTTTTTTTTPSAVASDDSLSIAAAGNTVTIADPTTIEKAFRFASESLGLVERVAGSQQKSSEAILAGAINRLDESQSGGAQRLLYFGGAALAALLGLAWVVTHK